MTVGHYLSDIIWVNAITEVMQKGFRVSPRGIDSMELICHTCIVPMINPIIQVKSRKLGYKFMAAEAAWILSGRDDVASIKPYSRDIENYSDDGKTFFGAYGPRIKDQIMYVKQKLSMDPDTRQAVVTTWRPNPPPTKDVPCTLAFQWLVRDRRLHCVVNMRSSDLWLGHPYDTFNFSALSFAILLDVNNFRERMGDQPLSLGNLYLTAGSKHIYDRNFLAASELIAEFDKKPTVDDELKFDCFDRTKYEDSHHFIEVLWQAAESENGARSLMMAPVLPERFD